MMSRMALLVFVIAASGLCGIVVPSADAQQGDWACSADVSKFCANVESGGGRIIQCLSQHSGELSPSCKAQVDMLKKRFEQTQKACQADVGKFCNGVQPGGGRIVKCLREHMSELSPGCSSEIQGVKGGVSQTK